MSYLEHPPQPLAEAATMETTTLAGVAYALPILRSVADLNPNPIPYRFANGQVVCESTKRVIRVGAEEIRLTRIQSELLLLLGSNPDAVVSRELIVEKVWDEVGRIDTYYDTLKTHIGYLRGLLGSELGHVKGVIRSKRNIGYVALGGLPVTW